MASSLTRIASDSASTSLSTYSSCEISDALVKLGIPSGGHIPDIISLSPAREWEGKICGPAYTVRMVDAKDETSPKPSGHFVDSAPEGHVMFVTSPVHSKSAVWGGLMSAGAINRKLLGTIIDGRLRDIGEHRSQDYAVFARGQSTLGQGTFTRPSELNVSLTVHPRIEVHASRTSEADSKEAQPAFPSTTINPGDILLADIDGVVCVPKGLVEEVVRRCAKSREVDDKCMADIKAGNPIKETFKKWRG